jgi:hypothetical protein
MSLFSFFYFFSVMQSLLIPSFIDPFIYSCNLTGYVPLPWPPKVPLSPSIWKDHEVAIKVKPVGTKSSDLSWFDLLLGDKFVRRPSSQATSSSDLLHLAALYSSAPPGLKNTTYAHNSTIDGSTGIYQTDCSCYISFLLHSLPGLKPHLAQIPPDTHPMVKPPAPRARSYFQFLESLKYSPNQYWKSVQTLHEAKVGDVLGWVVPGNNGDRDTGHTMILINAREILKSSNNGLKGLGYESGSAASRRLTVNSSASPLLKINETAYWVAVADASGLRHQLDTRCVEEGGEEEGASMKLSNQDKRYRCNPGVGRGFIMMSVMEDGTPRAFQFREGATARYYPIAIGRLNDT